MGTQNARSQWDDWPYHGKTHLEEAVKARLNAYRRQNEELLVVYSYPPRRKRQKFRYIDEPFEDSSTVCHEPEPHPDLCFCSECLS